MTTPEEKKAWEVEQCRCVAAEMNKLEGTDYVAKPSSKEPADVILESESSKFPARPAQVVSIPVDFRHRDDKDSVEKIRTAVYESLRKNGIEHCSVALILSGEAETHGMKAATLAQLCELALRAVGEGQQKTLRYEDICAYDAELADLIHDLIVCPAEVMEVEIPSGGALPLDGSWIEEGILKKVAKYGGAKAVADLTLVIGVAGFVDDDQIAMFRKANSVSSLPFAQIWIVTPFHGTVRLKPA